MQLKKRKHAIKLKLKPIVVNSKDIDQQKRTEKFINKHHSTNTSLRAETDDLKDTV